MLLSWIIVSAVCLWPDAVKASSFYDNPEQDPLQPQDTAEDLHNKWDFEVRQNVENLSGILSSYSKKRNFRYTVDFFDGDQLK